MIRTAAPRTLPAILTALLGALALGCGAEPDPGSGGPALGIESQDDMVEERLPPAGTYRTTFTNGQQVLFLNFNGQALSYTNSWSDASKNTTHIGAGGTIPAFSGDVQGVLTRVQSFYAPFKIKVVSSRPTSGSYEMVMVGGRSNDISYGKSVFGVAPLDCGDQHHNSVGFVFSGSIADAGWKSDPTKYTYMVASVTAHEAGHMFGLLHIANTCDLMSYARHTICPLNHKFENQLSALDSNSVGKCGGKSQQNSYQLLMAALGSSTSPPSGPLPVVKFLSPAKSATLGTSFKVDVEIQAPKGVTKVELLVRGKKAADLFGPPYSFQLTGLSPGPAKLDAIAHGADGKQGTASIVVTVKSTNQPSPQSKPWQAACKVDNECASGVCVNGTSGRFCSRSCSTTELCPGGYTCGGGVCRPGAQQPSSGGAFGAVCTGHQQCASGICGVNNTTGTTFCTQLCDMAAPSTCPQGSVCRAAGDKAACAPSSNNGGGSSSYDPADQILVGGCSVSSTAGASGGAPLSLLLGLALLLGLHRRRR